MPRKDFKVSRNGNLSEMNNSRQQIGLDRSLDHVHYMNFNELPEIIILLFLFLFGHIC